MSRRLSDLVSAGLGGKREDRMTPVLLDRLAVVALVVGHHCIADIGLGARTKNTSGPFAPFAGPYCPAEKMYSLSDSQRGYYSLCQLNWCAGHGRI
jgi:hypothetical protein